MNAVIAVLSHPHLVRGVRVKPGVVLKSGGPELQVLAESFLCLADLWPEIGGEVTVGEIIGAMAGVTKGEVIPAAIYRDYEGRLLYNHVLGVAQEVGVPVAVVDIPSRRLHLFFSEYEKVQFGKVEIGERTIELSKDGLAKAIALVGEVDLTIKCGTLSTTK